MSIRIFVTFVARKLSRLFAHKMVFGHGRGFFCSLLVVALIFACLFKFTFIKSTTKTPTYFEDILTYSTDNSSYPSVGSSTANLHQFSAVMPRKKRNRINELFSEPIIKLASELYGNEGVRSKEFRRITRQCLNFYERPIPFTDKTTFLREPQNLCLGEVYLLVGMILHVQDFEARNKIRDTWASLRYYGKYPVKFLFVIGVSHDSADQKRVVSEASANQDILQVSSVEGKRMTSKEILQAFLRWTAQRCPHVTYVFKTDEILFVDVFHVLQFLETASPSGFLCKTKKDKPNRRRRSRFYISRLAYRRKYYPRNCHGFAYFIKGDTVKDLYMCSLLLKNKRFSMADVLFTGIIAQRLSMDRQEFWASHSWTFFKPSLSSSSAAEYLFLRASQPNIALVYWHKTWREVFLSYS